MGPLMQTNVTVMMQSNEQRQLEERLDETAEGLPSRLDRILWAQNQGVPTYRAWKPHRGYVEPHLLRGRVPTAAELEHPFALEMAEAKAARRRQNQQFSFEQMRTQFLRDHGAEIRQNLAPCFEGNVSITPAPISSTVQQRFMQAFTDAPDSEIIPTFHGSDAKNYSSICERGLLIPGRSSGVEMAHGAAHGRGVYTACVDAPSLSIGFTSQPKMLVCGVVDDSMDLATQETCGRFSVTASSATIKHVGNAVVVKSERRVAPLFMVTADEYRQFHWSGAPGRPGGRVTTLSGWTNARVPLPGNKAVPAATKQQDFVDMGKGKTLHVASSQTAWMPPRPVDADKRDINQKRFYEAKRRDLQRKELRAAKVANQQQ